MFFTQSQNPCFREDQGFLNLYKAGQLRLTGLDFLLYN
jgi:hypothetical protein